MRILVRLGSEVTLKAKKCKARFIKLVESNLAGALKASGFTYSFERLWSRLIVEVNSPAAIIPMSRVFGIHSLSPIEHECPPDLESMQTVCERYYQEFVQDKSFKVKVKRSGVEGITSVQVERALGNLLRESAAGVDLERPEATVHVELRPSGAYFWTEEVPGPGGLPLSSQGRSLCLFSGGIDSPVAAWHMMRRGVALDFLFFNMGGAANERIVLSSLKFLCDLWGSGGDARVHVVDFRQVSDHLKAGDHKKYLQLFLKRSMWRIGARICNELGHVGLVVGDSCGQVSSQTLHNLAVLDAAIEIPVFRPLIGFDKDDIVAKARKIGTFNFSEHVREFCNITERHPITKTYPNVVARLEPQSINEVLEEAYVERRSYHVASIDLKRLAMDHLFVDKIEEDQILIDCRPAYQYRVWHAKGAINLEYETLRKSFAKLDKSASYVLYCPFGMQSAVAAELMQARGFTAYSFKGGTKALRQRERQSAG